MKKKATFRRGHKGFSLIELLIVVGIIMVIAAFAAPQINGMLQGLKLRATATDVNGLFQQLRIQCVKDNKSYTLKTLAAAGVNGITLFIDTNGNGLLDAGEASIQLPTNTTISDGTGGPAVRPPNVVIPPYIAANTVTLSFNERGLPCSNPPICNTIAPYVIYLSQARPGGAAVPGWGAITITQAGRIKAYTYTGGAAGTWQ